MDHWSRSARSIWSPRPAPRSRCRRRPHSTTGEDRMRRVPGGERGFVLVGVVMLVLALTILGLSLFSLSSFESQFLTRSRDQEAAFYAATGQIERVKFELARTGRLESSWFGVPDGVVDSSRAWQWQAGAMTETGTVYPGEVQILVHARVRQAERTVSGIYISNFAADYYRRLITTSGAISVDVGSPPLRQGTVWLEGKIYEAGPPSAWTNKITRIGPDSTQHNCDWIQPPAVQPLFNAHPGPLPAPRLVLNGVTPEWQLNANGSLPEYFGDPVDALAGGNASFS